jgi:hypothetical protein
MRMQPKFAQQLALLDCALFAQAFRSPQSNAHGRHSEHRPGLSAVRSERRIFLQMAEAWLKAVALAEHRERRQAVAGNRPQRLDAAEA